MVAGFDRLFKLKRKQKLKCVTHSTRVTYVLKKHFKFFGGIKQIINQ